MATRYAVKREQNGLVEALADVEHERWSKWMRWMFDNWVPENIERWKHQMHTAYADLPEHSKESDRKEARRSLAVINAAGYAIEPMEDSET